MPYYADTALEASEQISLTQRSDQNHRRDEDEAEDEHLGKVYARQLPARLVHACH